MYLTKIDLEISSLDVIELLGNTQKMHSAIQRMFKRSREDAKVLYRIRFTNGGVIVYITSENEPTQDMGIRGVKNKTVVRMDDFIESSVRNGKKIRFDTVVVPSKRIKSTGTEKKFFIRDAEERIKWIKRKLAENGIDVENELFSVIEANDNIEVNIVHEKEKGGVGKLHGVEMCGTAIVNDENLLKKALISGIGSGKAYGFGMLLLS